MTSINQRSPALVWRKRNHYTQSDVAQLTGLSEQTIRRVEHGTLALPPQIAELMGGSATYHYDLWRSDCRAEIKANMADEIREAVLWINNNLDSLHPEFNAFKAFRAHLNLSSVNSLASLLKVDPRRITEVEDGSRLLGVEYRRALLQIGVSASTIQTWEEEAQND